MNNYNNIPDELKALPHWLVWKYEDIGAKKPTKVPYSPIITTRHADINNPETWGTFEQAVTASTQFDGIGFVFTDNDPYTFIDLDDPSTLHTGQPNPNHQSDLDRQIKIFKEFDSYSEISPSGKGLHTIIRGKVLSGRRRSFIEIYSSQRYATFTGNVYHNKPIINQQEKLTQLWEQMGSAGPATYIYNGDDKEIFTDNEILEKAKNAVNGEKFIKLFDGRWNDLYPSQSEADYAFIDIIAFYTQNRKQIQRIFELSSLGKRDKAKRKDYVGGMILKAFDRMLPQIDFDGFKNAIELSVAKEQQQLELGLAASSKPIDLNPMPATSNPKAKLKFKRYTDGIPVPPGLMGEIAQFIYQAAPRPVPEMALAAAIGLMAGITGRSYNVSGTGLNQYVVLVADSGTGKEAMASGISKLIKAISLQVSTSNSFIGPGRIASGQALVKYIDKHPCFVSVIGEIGLRLQSMSGQNVSSSERALKETLLDLYNKSGFYDVFTPAIYADKEKNTFQLNSPSLSILGESTPENFYGALTEENISEGFLPRFLIIEYNGPRVPLNENHIHAVPQFQLIDRLAGLTAHCETLMHNKRVVDIKIESEALSVLNEFNRFCDDKINEAGSKQMLRQLWNRAHIKALKLASLIAIGVNMADPVILLDYADWAINMVHADVRKIWVKFEKGEIGGLSGAEPKQTFEILRILKEYVTLPYDKIMGYDVNRILYQHKIVPYSYIQKRLVSMAAYRHDRMGATNAIKRTIQALIDADILREVGRGDLAVKYGTTQRSFIISNIDKVMSG